MFSSCMQCSQEENLVQQYPPELVPMDIGVTQEYAGEWEGIVMIVNPKP